MTTTKVRDSVVSFTLTSAGVKKAVKSYTMSKRYINMMMKATIINILYHRLSINKKEFVVKTFNNIIYRTFRSKSSNIYIREFHTYMLACKDALDKNYLREFYLYFIDVASGDILENYKFSFQYDDKNEPHEEQSEKSLSDSTCQMLRTLEELGKHDKVDIEIQLKAEFTYFDDTPDDYEPPGFRKVDEDDSLISKLAKKGNSIVIGTLFTGFHLLKCRGRGEIFNYNTSINEEIHISDSEDMEIRKETKPSDSIQVLINYNKDIMTEDFSPALEAGNDVIKPKTHISKESVHFDDTYLSQVTEISSDEGEIGCACKIPDSDSCPLDLIKCKICKRTYHTACQGYLDNTFLLTNSFKCLHCRGDDESEIATYDGTQLESLFRLRYALGAMYAHGKMPTKFKTMFGETVNMLKALTIFELDGNRVKKVNIRALNEIFKFDFKEPDEKKFKML